MTLTSQKKLTPIIAFVVSAAASFAGALIAVPFNTIIYSFVREENTREFIMFREYPVAIAHILVYGAGILVSPHITYLFWLALAAYATFIVMPKLNLKGAQLSSS
jgi:hypothetical protein